MVGKYSWQIVTLKYTLGAPMASEWADCRLSSASVKSSGCTENPDQTSSCSWRRVGIPRGPKLRKLKNIILIAFLKTVPSQLLTLFRLNLSWIHKIYIFYHVLTLRWHSWLKSFLTENKDPLFLQCQCKQFLSSPGPNLKMAFPGMGIFITKIRRS